MKLQLTAIHLMYPVPLEKESVLKRELKQRDVVNSKCFVCESSVKSQYRGAILTMRTSTLSTLSFILLLSGCASSGGFENTRYDSYWKDDKRPNPQTLLACAEYARVSASYSTQGYEAPPMNQVVAWLNQPN